MSFLCCAAVPVDKREKQRKLQQTRADVERQTKRHLRMSNDQIYEFTQRFESKAVNHHMSFKNYKDSLGLIGVDSLSFLADRMFAVMDEDSKGYVSALLSDSCFRSPWGSTYRTSTRCCTGRSSRSCCRVFNCWTSAEKENLHLKTSTRWCSRLLKCGLLL